MAESRATLSNWRTPPFSGWAFHHVRELIPTAGIAAGHGGARALDTAPRALDLEEFHGRSASDGFIVVHRGAVVHAHYAQGMGEHDPHILMSVSKAMLGLLASRVPELEPERQIAEYVPEVAATAWRGARVRDVLDMRVGIAFDENYLASAGPIIEYRKATGWNPLAPGETASDLLTFCRQLRAGEGPHGGPVHYVSPNSDLLGIAIERATGRRYAELMSERVWRPAGARTSAYITLDRLGAARAAGGLCATLCDLARVGLWMLATQQAFCEDLERNGDAQAWAAGDMAAYFPRRPMRYRSYWYVLDGAAPLLFGYGIHGQWLFLDRRNELVIAKLSSQALPMDPALIALTLETVERIRAELAA